MQLKFRIVHFLVILLMGFLATASLVLLGVFRYETPAADIYLPKRAEWAVRVDLERLAKDEVYTLLFRAKDEELITVLRKMADERVQKTNENGPLTIDFRQDVVVFGFRHNNRRYIGFQFSVLEPETFRANSGKHLPNGYYPQVNDHTALVLFCPDQKTIDGAHRKDMLTFAADLLRDTRKWELPHAKTGQPSFLTIETTAFRDGQGTMTLDIFEKDQELSWKGNFRQEVTLHPANYTLKSSGLYLSTAIIPEGLSDSLNRLLPVGNFRLPELRAVTADYLGLAIAETSMGMRPLPKMNLILESVQPFSADSLLQSVPVELRGKRNSIHAASLTYYVKQLDEHTVFIGLDTNAIRTEKATLLCDLHGAPGVLNRIEASPTLLAFMDLVPQFRFGKLFVGSTQKIELSIAPANGKTCTVKGKLVFREGAYPLHETVKLLIGLGVVG